MIAIVVCQWSQSGPSSGGDSWLAYKTEISSADDGSKTTVWVSKPDRRVVKIVATSPRLNGGTMTSELQ